jgi:hypothetical protein
LAPSIGKIRLCKGDRFFATPLKSPFFQNRLSNPREINTNSTAPFQPPDGRLKWRKIVPLAEPRARFYAFVEFTS